MIYNRIIYSALLLMSLIVTIYTANTAAYLIFYSMILLPVISLIFTVIVKKSTDIEQSLSESVIEKGSYTKIFINEKASYKYHTDKNISYKNEHDYISVKAMKRGRYKIGVASIAYVDWLNLFRIYKKIDNELTLDVTPKSIPLSWLPIDASGYASKGLYGNGIEYDYEDVIGLAEYTQYDSLRDVNWKMSAKKGELIVKKYNKPSKKEITLIIDNRNVNEDFIDAIFSCYMYIRQNGYETTIHYIKDGEWVNTKQNIINQIEAHDITLPFTAKISSTALLLTMKTNYTIKNIPVVEFSNIEKFIRIYG